MLSNYAPGNHDEEQIPLKQGLKLEKLAACSSQGVDEEQIPLKQGLKRTLPFTRYKVRVWMKSKFH